MNSEEIYMLKEQSDQSKLQRTVVFKSKKRMVGAGYFSLEDASR